MRPVMHGGLRGAACRQAASQQAFLGHRNARKESTHRTAAVMAVRKANRGAAGILPRAPGQPGSQAARQPGSQPARLLLLQLLILLTHAELAVLWHMPQEGGARHEGWCFGLRSDSTTADGLILHSLA